MLTDPAFTTEQARAPRRLGREQRPEPDRHLHHSRPRRLLVRRRPAGRTVRRAHRRLGGHDRADARQRRRAAVSLGQGVPGHPAGRRDRGDGAGQPLHPRGTRSRDRRDRVLRHHRHDEPAGPRPRSGRGRRRGLQRHPPLPRGEHPRTTTRMAGRDRQARGARAPGHGRGSPEPGSRRRPEQHRRNPTIPRDSNELVQTENRPSTSSTR